MTLVIWTAVACWLAGIVLAVRHGTYLGVAVLVAFAALIVFGATILLYGFADDRVEGLAIDNLLKVGLAVFVTLTSSAVAAIAFWKHRVDLMRSHSDRLIYRIADAFAAGDHDGARQSPPDLVPH